jgi:hypothetical protein
MTTIDNKMTGKYVIVRCRDAGVHSGYLEQYHGRECVLTKSRRLWYWRPADGAKYLSGVATEGLASDSKLGAELERLHLTENCEIILCTKKAEASLVNFPTDVR